MEISELKGRHLVAVLDHLQSLTSMYPGIDENPDHVSVRLAMMMHDENPTDIGRAEELIKSRSTVFLAYAAPIVRLHGQAQQLARARRETAEGFSIELPDDGRTVDIRPLTGEEWRLALSEAQRLARLATMTGLAEDDCKELSLLDYLTLEEVAAPFVSEVWTALVTGGDSWLSLFDEEPALQEST